MIRICLIAIILASLLPVVLCADDPWAPLGGEDHNRNDDWAPAEKEEKEPPDKADMLAEVIANWSGTRPMDIRSFRKRRLKVRSEEPGIELPLNSNLQINGYKSITLEYNYTHYFGRSDISRYYGGGGYRSFTSGFSGFDLGGDYDYGYYGGYSSFDYGMGGFGSFGGYGSYGGYGYGGYGYRGPRATGLNIEQALEVGLHGRIGEHTHVSVDYSDTGSDYYSGISNKQQKIAVWYEGGENSIIKKAAFGDLTLDLPNVRFLNLTRNLFGVQLLAELKGIRFTAFGSRSKGLKGKWRSRGESQRAGGGMGMRIADTNYIKGRYYALNVDSDGMIRQSLLPIKPGSEEIYIDDGDGTNNVGGVKTAQGYFDLQYPGEDYNLNYDTGEIEFLKPISPRYRIVAAYEYLGEGGGRMGNPGHVFEDDDGDGVIDEPDERIGYVVIKEADRPGAELRNVYSLGNRNISPRDYEITIWREGGTDVFQTDKGPVPYIQIFGLDQDGDGIVDPEFIDFEKGLLRFPSPHPFMIEDPKSPYYKYKDQLNNEALYSDNPRYTDQMYTIHAEYSYRFDTYSLNRLNIIPGSEVVRVNGQKLQRDVDYMMIYETGTITFFRKLDEYDEIEVEYEYAPFGGSMQQSVAGVWAEYSYEPKGAEETKPSLPPSQTLPMGGGLGGYGGGYSGYGRYGGYSSFGGFGGYSGYSSFGGSYYGGYSRRRSYGTFGPTFTPTFKKGFHISAGYIYNAGGGGMLVPDVNGAPNRVQAFDVNTSLGHTFNLARLIDPLPLISMDKLPLSIDFSGEAAYSRNNPNSFGYALVDGMEGVRESTTISTFKFDWKQSSKPLDPNVDLFGRVLLRMARKDEEEVEGNYYKNRRLPSSVINPLARSTEEETVMEIGYEMNATKSWAGLSRSLSEESIDLSDRDFLNMWVKVEGDDDIILHVDIGVVSEDSDEDSRLDSEDLPEDLQDTNGDGKVDILDLSLEDLPENQKYKGNGILESGEDTGWTYNYGGVEYQIGAGNSVLDTEDLNGDMVLDTIDSYFEISIPLDSIPKEWLKKENRNSGWRFLSIPLSEAKAWGRPPSWGYIKHVRIWIEKSGATAKGKLLWSGMEIVGNKWERGVVIDQTGTVKTETDERFLVGAKDNFDYDDYFTAYKELEGNREFRKLHPMVQTGFGFFESQPREQSLTLNYKLDPNSMGVTSEPLRGQRPGDGQDFSKYDRLSLWVHGDGRGGTFVMRLGTALRTGGYYYSSYRYGGYGGYERPKPPEPVNIFKQGTQDYYEFTMPVDFVGWRKVDIDLRDKDRDGHPDGLQVHGNPSIANIGGILLGIRNDKGEPIEGEVWVNDIHLAEPTIRAGWARRGDFALTLGQRLSVRGGYARQDKQFESSAGQAETYGSYYSSYSSGYSTSTYDYNFNSELRIFDWLPIRYTMRYNESETEARRGTISSYTYGKNRGTSRNLSLQIRRPPFPTLGFSVDKQSLWNERRGTDLSTLYMGSFSYDLKGKLGVDVEYRHEEADVKPETAVKTEGTGRGYYTSSYYGGYYGGRGKEKVDSGAVSLRINPIQGFGLNPSYDVVRELEYREETPKTGIASGSESVRRTGRYVLASRSQRFSLRPTLKDFLGIRPSLGSRLSFRETWFGGNKDASLDIDSDFRLDIRPQKWFKFEKKPVQSLSGNGGEISTQIPQSQEDIEERERRRLEYYGVTPDQLERMEEQRGDWIDRERAKIERKLKERERMGVKPTKSLFEQIITTTTLGGGVSFSTTDYLRKLKEGTDVLDVLRLPEDAPERSRSTRRTRISFRGSVDPLTWASIGFDYSRYHIFSKTAGTTSKDDSSSYDADLKLFNSANTSTLQLKYAYSTNSRSTSRARIYFSRGHSPSLAWQQRWGEGTSTALGVMLTFKESERSGIKGKALIIKPNFNVSYKLHLEGSLTLPLLNRDISLNHDFNLRNTFATVITRRTLGLNREDKSERYETSLYADYNLSSRIRMNLHLSVVYNNDRVEEGRDYISILGALMARGEFR